MLVFFNTAENLRTLRTNLNWPIDYTKSFTNDYLKSLSCAYPAHPSSNFYRSHNQIYDKTAKYNNWIYVCELSGSQEQLEQQLDQLLEFRLSQTHVLTKTIENSQDFLKSFEKWFRLYDELTTLYLSIKRIYTDDPFDRLSGDHLSVTEGIMKPITDIMSNLRIELNQSLKHYIKHYDAVLDERLCSSDSLEANIATLSQLPQQVVQNIRNLFA